MYSLNLNFFIRTEIKLQKLNMDVTAFSGDNFDAKDWINKALKSSEPGQSKEEVAGSLVMKLQLMIAKLNTALEDQCNAVVQSVPRVIREAGQLELEAALLSDKLATIRAEMESVEMETRENMSSLVRMDAVKERLSATSRALQEADNWTSLDNQVEDAFDNNEHCVVTEKLAGMQQSLRLLSHVPDYQERLAHLEQHKNRLEATLSPLLVAAFTTRNTETALGLVQMFRSIERDKQLTKYYHKCVRAGLLQHWAGLVSEGEGELEGWLDSWYSHLLTELAHHQTWVNTVFSQVSSSVLLCELLTDVFSSLHPSPQFCLEAAVKLTTDVLGLLLTIKTSTDKFLASVETFVAGAGDQKLRELGKAVYRPFLGQIGRYEDLEVAVMTGAVQSWVVEKKDTIDELHSLTGSVSKLAGLVEAATQRCLALTAGTAFPALSRAVARSLDTHLDRYRKLTRRLEKKKVIVDDDWSVLQHCLTANQITGELLLMLEQLEVSVSTAFLESSRPYLGPDSSENPLHQHHIFLLDSGDILRLNELYSSISSPSGTASPMLQESMTLLAGICSDLQKTTFSLMFHPVSAQLEQIPGLNTWAATTSGQSSLETAEMPEFSLSPSEYITCVGEFLMTLPQHLDPYMSQDSPALLRALRQNVFPGGSEAGSLQSPADFLLGCISSSTCSSYISYISSIPSLNTGSAKQLAVDISYLGDILDDLGHPVSSDLSSTGCLLRLAQTSWAQESQGHPAKIVSLVRKLRRI